MNEKRRQWLWMSLAGLAGLSSAVAWQLHRQPALAAADLAALWAAEFDAPDGTPVALQTFRGRPLVLNFWATWCYWTPSINKIRPKAGKYSVWPLINPVRCGVS
jgi:thiol-disulfide isomerase/thioredoxin